MAMGFITFILILLICDWYIVMTQSARSEDDRGYQRTPRPDKASMKRFLTMRQNEGVRSDQGKAMRKKSRIDKESLAASGSSAKDTVTRMESEHQKGAMSSKRYIWTNDQYDSFLRLSYAHYYKSAQSDTGLFNWKTIFSHWGGPCDKATYDVMRSLITRMQNRIATAMDKFDENMKWSKGMNHDLLKFYYETEERDKSKHAERMHAAWVQKYPDHSKLTPKYLLERAETMLGSVMKFDLNNPRGEYKSGQKVDWLPKHDNLFRYLWQKYPANETNRVGKIYNDAVNVFPTMGLLDEMKVYDHARLVNAKSKTNLEIKSSSRTTNNLGSSKPRTETSIARNEGDVQNKGYGRFHTFIDDQNHSPMVREPDHNDEWVPPSTSSNPGPSHNHPNLELRLNTVNVGDKEPDTTLKLGW